MFSSIDLHAILYTDVLISQAETLLGQFLTLMDAPEAAQVSGPVIAIIQPV